MQSKDNRTVGILPLGRPTFDVPFAEENLERMLAALEATGYRIVGPLSVRVAFDFVRYGLGFSPDPMDTYRAGGAVDMYLGGNVGVRLTF